MGVRRVVLAVAVLLVPACAGSDGSDGSDGAGVEPTALAGETDQGMRLRIDVVQGREISLRIPIDCERRAESGGTETLAVPLHRHPVRAEVDGDGAFEIDESYVEEGTDGDEEHIDVRVAGTFQPDGPATGTIEVRSRHWNGQGESFGPDCETGILGWTAGEPPRRGDDLTVEGLEPVVAAAVGPDLLTVSETGETARIDETTGEARALDGSAPPAPTSTSTEPADEDEDDDSAPVTVAAPPRGAFYLDELAVVAEGAWMADPATGELARTELADGRRSATTGVPAESLAAGRDALWTVSNDRLHATYLLERRDPVTGEVLASAPVAQGPIAVGPAGVWHVYLPLSGGGRLDRIDPATARPAETFEVDADPPPERMVVTEDRVWVTDWTEITSVDPTTGRVAVVDLPTEPTSMAAAADGGGVWVAHDRERVIRRVEAGGIARTVDVPEGTWDVTVTDDGSVWLTADHYGVDAGRPHVVRLDPTTTGT